MESVEELLEELKKASGITFRIEDSPYDEAGTSERLSDLLSFYRNTDMRSDFFVRFLSGRLSEEEAADGISRFHLMEDAFYSLFVLRFRTDYDPSVFSVLSNLINPSEDLFIRMDNHTIVLLRRAAKRPDDSELTSFAETLSDMLAAEAMQTVSVGYDRCVQNAAALPDAYRNATSALTIGLHFSEGDHTFGYFRLGLPRLLSTVPKKDAEAYLRDHFPDFSFSDLDEETLATIHSLFENGLNIAETARSLFMHRNTLIYRLDKFQRKSHLDLRKFDDAVTCQVGMILSELLGDK